MKLYKVERWNNGTDGWDGNKETLAYFTNIEAASEYSKDNVKIRWLNLINSL